MGLLDFLDRVSGAEHKPLLHPFAPETPLLSFTGSARDVWSIRDAFEGVQIFGAVGSGKTSGSGETIARAFLAAGFGGLVLTAKPDERELWVADGVRNRLQVFDARVYPPIAIKVIELPAQPRWIAFSIDGRYAYASTGDVVSAATRTIVGALEDAAGAKVASENLLEIDFVDGQPIRSAGSGIEKIPESGWNMHSGER